MRRRYLILGGLAALAFVLDQLSKWWVMTAIPEHRPVVVIPGFFDLINIRNRGAAFGFLNRSDIEWQFWLFLAATVVAAWAIIAWCAAHAINPGSSPGWAGAGRCSGQPGGPPALPGRGGFFGFLLGRLALARLQCGGYGHLYRRLSGLSGHLAQIAGNARDGASDRDTSGTGRKA